MVTKQPLTVTEALNEIILVELRRHGISHTNMARTLGIGRDTFARRLDGPHGFTGAELERIASSLGTTPSRLLSLAEIRSLASQAVSA
ncbi:helix-turn-helix domain-containing protein [Actinomycetaceae bacterium WB03_NA08]|uniref:Helix-turn-helix domain-containing protein n=1 Tax=Scrofimicrobium canadense TaxID=2652290 RepID=A0A6N7W940_9ACTO|nr:helix-turn-helix domain-containing protein [Scrofimicrobium canadense]MSS85003.1 helix-turn-helix domain-containing protein [Scrofimicrobium canadense]